MIFIRHPFDCELKYLEFEKSTVTANAVIDRISFNTGYTEFLLFYNGKRLQEDDVIPDHSTVHVAFSLPGGKGGFGSMLRAIGAQIEKTTNREACRDLSGRRLRDINEEQRLKKWIAKEAEREADKIRRRQARIERLKSKPAHKFFDFEYEKEISELPNRINDAMNEGLKKAKEPVKRPQKNPGPSEPLKKKWLADEFSSSSNSDSVTEDGNSSKKLKLSKDSSSSESDISDLLQPGPSSSRQDSHFDSEESLTLNSESGSLKMDIQSEDSVNELSNSKNEKVLEDVCNTDSVNELSNSKNEKVLEDVCNTDKKQEGMVQEVKQSNETTDATNKSNLNIDSAAKEPVKEDNLPINLLDFQNASDLESLGLDKLKAELMLRGLKCGGSLSDRAKRLWMIRDLQPSKYPANLLAKCKK